MPGLRPNRQQKLTDSRILLLVAVCSQAVLFNESKPYSSTLLSRERPSLMKISESYPPSSEYLCANDRISDARPLPSHITTGKGGSSRRHSKTMEITLGPPSTMSPTTGTPCPSPAKNRRTETKEVLLKLSWRGWDIMSGCHSCVTASLQTRAVRKSWPFQGQHQDKCRYAVS